ncbi:MAG: phosphatidylglycerophosphatase A [Nitrospirae bacterium]|nr:phosphatidylglycerophosphatase A [Nitrospirota bacterium]
MVILKYIATIGIIGYFPLAPGTFSSLIALALFILLKPTPLIHIIILLIITPLSIFSSHYAEKLFNSKDSKHIVIDEFCGYFISVFLTPFSYAFSAFILFRVFDILKPFPIRKIEYILEGGVGIVADDIMAALYTNIILQIWKLFYYNP